MTVTTGARVSMSSGFDSSPSAETSSSSKLRISISAPNSRAMSLAVSMSSVLLMVIIMRFINSLASTSFTRTSSLSARSFTVMPSASVMVRVIGGGAAGADGIDGADGRSRRVCVGRWPGPLLPERRTLLAERRPLTGRAGMPGRACPGCCVRIGCDGSGRGPPSMPGVVGRGGGGYGGRGWPGAPGRARRLRAARRAGLPARAPRRRLCRAAAARCAAARPAAAWPAPADARAAAAGRALRCADEASAARTGPAAATAGGAARRSGRQFGCRFLDRRGSSTAAGAARRAAPR